MIHHTANGRDYLLVTVPEKYGLPYISGNHLYVEEGRSWKDFPEFGRAKLFKLPSGKWSLIGRASELNEEQIKPFKEALSLHNLLPETTVIIIKEK